MFGCDLCPAALDRLMLGCAFAPRCPHRRAGVPGGRHPVTLAPGRTARCIKPGAAAA
jgi:hypothetical protein